MGSPSSHTHSESARPTVLVVDDDEYVHGALEAALRGLHVQLLTARTAAEGERLALLHQPALAIVDVGLPDVDGYELTARLRAGGMTRMRVIILTGYSPDEATAKRAGADALLGKPFRLHVFLDLVRAQLGAKADEDSRVPMPAAQSSGLA